MNSLKVEITTSPNARRIAFATLLFSAIGLFAAPNTDYKIDRNLLNKLTEDAGATAPFFVVFGERPDLASASTNLNRSNRGAAVVQALQATAGRSQAGVQGFLRGRNVDFTPFWVENKIYVPSGTLELARTLAQRPEVVAILPESVYSIPQPQQTASIGTQATEWNISKIHADQVWPTTTGAGIVVANIDTGVQYDHPALVRQYRGNTGSGFNHIGNWKDPTHKCGHGEPCDNVGHGTHTMGTMVGNDGGTNQIGVAPGAKWMACKGCSGTSCSDSDLIACAQWIMDPLENGSGLNQPDIINNSWGGAGGRSYYQFYVQNWRAAGIFPAFANGNSGPACNTAGSPGDYPESFASGATDSTDFAPWFSSRGKSAFGGIKPDIAAPGYQIRSSIPTGSYTTYSGTSMASPHTAATVALVWAAAPSYLGQIGSTEQVLRQSAAVLTTTETCGGVSAGASPNNTYGSGRLDALAAVMKARTTTILPPTISISAPANGASFNCPVTVTLSAAASDPKDGNLTAAIKWSDEGTAIGAGGTVSKNYACTEAGNHNIVAEVTNTAGVSVTASITVALVNPNIVAAPSNLSATVSGSSVLLTWTDNSSNEAAFGLERKKNGGSWSVISSPIPAAPSTGSTLSYTDSPGKGGWQYRVSALSSVYGSSTPSNVVSVHVSQ
jgi:subtilisin family serine protease